jgi:hypothetical protein
MQVYLPDGMYQQVKTRGLPVSQLLQKAVQAELRRLAAGNKRNGQARNRPDSLPVAGKDADAMSGLEVKPEFLFQLRSD